MTRNLWWKRTLLVAGTLAALVACFLVGVVAGRLWQFSIDNRRALHEVAQRLEVQEDWQAVQEHVYCDALASGLTWEDIQVRLSDVSPYSIVNDPGSRASRTIVFDNYFARLALSDIVLWFDENGQLIDRGLWSGLEIVTIAACP